MRNLLVVCGLFAAFAVLGAVGGLQGLTESLSLPQRADAVYANADALRSGALRLLVIVIAGSAAVWAVATGRLRGVAAAAALLVIVTVDLWLVDRRFYEFSPRADVLFADDAVTRHLKAAPMPYRVIDPGSSYSHAILMAYKVPSVLGYHGFELRSYDELGGAAKGWQNLGTPNLLDLLAVRYAIFPAEQPLPGFHQVVGPTRTAFGTTAVLFERDSIPQYARVIPAATKIPESQIVPTVVDPRFPVNNVLLFPDTSSVAADSLTQTLAPSSRTARVTAWEPGKMTIAITGTDAKAGHLLVSENWYKDWNATVDGKAGVVRRANHTLLSVELPLDAKEVQLEFKSKAYATGKILSLLSLILALVWIALPLVRRRRDDARVPAPAA
jgi:hypothetical protein